MKSRSIKAAQLVAAVCVMNLTGMVSASPTVGPLYDTHPSVMVGLTLNLGADQNTHTNTGLVLTWNTPTHNLDVGGPLWELKETEFSVVHRLRRLAAEQDRSTPVSSGQVETSLAP